MSKKILLAFFLVSVFFGIIFAFYALSVYTSANFSTKNGSKISIFIDEATTIDDIFGIVESKTTQKYGSSFQKISKYRGLEGKISCGHYVIEDGMSNQQLFNRLAGGMQSPVKIKFNNIRLLPELASKLDDQLMIDSADIAALLFDEKYVKSLGFNEQTFISMFIPNTYEVYWDITAEELMERMKAEYDRFWNSKNRKQKAADLKLSFQEVSTLASIVDGETNSRAEKPIVAGLYLNRIKRGIPLQADPTVKFAVGDFTLTQILYKHLNVDSKYNTYKYAGLPPGPIAMPTISGIDAVLNYTKHKYIYMCAKETLDGTHNFAVSLSQHNVNAAKYHRALRAWKRKNKK